MSTPEFRPPSQVSPFPDGGFNPQPQATEDDYDPNGTDEEEGEEVPEEEEDVTEEESKYNRHGCWRIRDPREHQTFADR